MDNKRLIGQYCQQFKMGGIISRIDQLVMEAEANASGYHWENFPGSRSLR